MNRSPEARVHARPQWVNTEPDEGAPHALLERVAAQYPPEILDELWIFPTRRAGGVESTVVVVAAHGEDLERRRVATAHFSVTRDKKGRPTVTERFEEHALAPAGALGRIVDGVLRRLGDEMAAPPRAERIDRDPERWHALIVDLGGPPPPAAAPDAAETTEPRPGAEQGADVADPPGDAPGREPEAPSGT
jgi:hypothetical protein